MQWSIFSNKKQLHILILTCECYHFFSCSQLLKRKNKTCGPIGPTNKFCTLWTTFYKLCFQNSGKLYPTTTTLLIHGKFLEKEKEDVESKWCWKIILMGETDAKKYVLNILLIGDSISVKKKSTKFIF